MAATEQTPGNKTSVKLKTVLVKGVAGCRPVIKDVIVPQSKKCALAGKYLCTRILVPCVAGSTKLIRREFANIHASQNWFKRCGLTLSSNAVGLIMAMSSTRIVEHFVEVREMGNLWGLLASRPVVSDTAFEVLNFLAEFLVALVVFTITEHYYEAFRQRNKQ